MFDYQAAITMLHLHGDERHPMVERGHDDAAAHDPERGWRERARIFRCTSCADEVVVIAPGHDTPEAKPA